MARTRNSTFAGTAPPDADVDVASYTTIIKELNQDANLTYDKITGENGISSTAVIIKNGESGRGPPMRRPVVNQELIRYQWNQGNRLGNMAMAAADVSLYGGRCYVLAVPFFVPQGESVYTLDLVAYSMGSSEFEVEIRDSTWALYNEQVASRLNLPNGEDETFRAILQFNAPGQYYILVKHVVTEQTRDLLRWRVYPNNVRAGAMTTGSQPSGYSPFASGNGAGATFETIDDDMIQDDYPVAAWVMSTLNRNINWLIEFITGYGTIGNTPGDRDLSRHWDHSGSSPFSGEGDIEYPLFAEALGACQVEGCAVVVNSAGTRGFLSWPAIIPLYGGTTRRTFHRCDIYVPDLPNTTLRCRVLAANENGKGTPTAWDFRVTSSAGSTTAASFTQLGSSDFYTAEVTGITATTYGEVENFQLELARSAGVTVHGEIQILGFQFYFDP